MKKLKPTRMAMLISLAFSAPLLMAQQATDVGKINVEGQPGATDTGLIAQEVQEVLPELVVMGPAKQWKKDGSGLVDLDEKGMEIKDFSKVEPYSVFYDRLSVYLLAIVKEQEARINELEKKLEMMEKK